MWPPGLERQRLRQEPQRMIQGVSGSWGPWMRKSLGRVEASGMLGVLEWSCLYKEFPETAHRLLPMYCSCIGTGPQGEFASWLRLGGACSSHTRANSWERDWW